MNEQNMKRDQSPEVAGPSASGLPTLGGMSWDKWMDLLSIDEMEHIAKRTGFWNDPSKAPEFEAECNIKRYLKIQGSKGGKASKRELTRAESLAMVEAKKLKARDHKHEPGAYGVCFRCGLEKSQHVIAEYNKEQALEDIQTESDNELREELRKERDLSAAGESSRVVGVEPKAESGAVEAKRAKAANRPSVIYTGLRTQSRDGTVRL